MTDNEIVKGLEVCQNISGETCDDCPYEESKHLDEVMPNGLNYDQMSCDMWLQMDSLDLINRQKAEIERLNKEVETFADIGKMYSEVKAEAVKEFAERLKKEINVRTTFSKEQDKNVLIYIDNILKELVGDDE